MYPGKKWKKVERKERPDRTAHGKCTGKEVVAWPWGSAYNEEEIEIRYAISELFNSYIPLKANYAKHSGEPQKAKCVQQGLPHLESRLHSI